MLLSNLANLKKASGELAFFFLRLETKWKVTSSYVMMGDVIYCQTYFLNMFYAPVSGLFWKTDRGKTNKIGMA